MMLVTSILRARIQHSPALCSASLLLSSLSTLRVRFLCHITTHLSRHTAMQLELSHHQPHKYLSPGLSTLRHSPVPPFLSHQSRPGNHWQQPAQLLSRAVGANTAHLAVSTSAIVGVGPFADHIPEHVPTLFASVKSSTVTDEDGAGAHDV